MSNRITIKDIAKALGMHHSTVSRALRNDVRVKESTRKAIIEFTRKHGYQVNMNALQLRGEAKNVIAVIVPNINHSFFSGIVSYLTDLATEQGYIVSIFQSNEQIEHEERIIDTVIQHDVAGVIASVAMETTSSAHLKKLQEFTIPLVLFDRVVNNIDVSKVTVENKIAILEVLDQFIMEGCRSILHISGPQHLNVFHNRREAYLEGLQKYGIDKVLTLNIDRAFTMADGKRAVSNYLNNNPRPDAILCDSNVLLMGVLMELKERNITISDDIRLAGFSGEEPLELFHPGIISIYQPTRLIAQKSFDLLIEMIKQKDCIFKEEIKIESFIKQNIILT
ncbi:MAG: LacI family DNA-binding transcriptional regulator [Bacteroidota bacterium]